jgi:hypothetical protein
MPMDADAVNDGAANDSAARRAKGVLWLAVGLLVMAQVAGTDQSTRMPVWAIKEWPRIALGIWTGFGGHVDDVQLWRKFAVGVSAVGVLIGAPWFVSLLSRARPLLWTLRILMSVLWVVWLRMGTSLDHLWFTTDIEELRLELYLLKEQLSAEPGFWTYMAALLMNAIGLWMIPKAVKDQPYATAEIPTTDERR